MAVTARTRGTSHRRRSLTTGVAALGIAVLATGVATAASVSGGFGHERVGQQDSRGILLPTNQRITPVGKRIQINNGRLLSSALSPNGLDVAALSYERGTGFLTILNVKSGKLVQQLGTGFAGDPKLGDGSVAADGPLYSADGKTLWFPQTADLLRFSVGADGTVAPAPTVIKLSDAAGPYLPSGMALSPDGSRLYVALNGANTLGVIDTATNALVSQTKVGIAPRQVSIVGSEAFVSNEGGRPAKPGDSTNLTNNTPVAVNPVTGAVNNGSVSVVDLVSNKVSSIKVGLEPTALYAHGKTLFVANSNDDSVSVIDTAKKKVVQTFNVNPLPGSTVGSYPNAITMPDPQHILVSIGRDNALATYRYKGPSAPVQYEGLIPTDWYPVNVVMDAALKKIVVTSDKGIGTRGPKSTISEGPNTNIVTGYNTYDDTGSVNVFSPQSDADLQKSTKQVFINNDWEKLLASAPVKASTAKPVPIPVKLGDPSSIKHVFLLVKENRTYDQVFGDVGKGNSDPTLTQFGASITPNEHALVNQYGLFDNFYDEGTLSADGHNWLMQADANDYIEKEFGAFYRSYPAQGGDALAYQRNGFLWNATEKAGKTVKDFGEYANFFNVPDKGAPTWQDWYADSQILEGKAAGPLPVPVDKYQTYSDIPSLNAIIDKNYPRFNTDVPDQYRTDIWLKSFKQSEKTGKLANLNMLWVPDDHTAGTSGTDPYPTAQVADNDLAVGRIIDAISHSKFWKDSAVFVLEDDSQNGTDHVDGHRSPLMVASPYAVRGKVIDTYYSQLNVVKTIEQILGVAPMNQEDRAATPMFDAFTSKPSSKAFNVRPNQIPLTYGLKTSTTAVPAAAGASAGVAKAAGGPAGGGVVASGGVSVPAAQAGVYQQWQVWSNHQNFGGAKASEDRANPAQLNRLDWYAATGWMRPFPGDKTILGPYQVPGWDRPAAEVG